MLRPIVQLGDSVLKTPARRVEPSEIVGEVIQSLLRDMRETLAEAGGVGLAAPQVGESLRAILAGSFPTLSSPNRPDQPIRAMINPQIVVASEATTSDWEGCLSFLRFRVQVTRHQTVTVEYLSSEGTVETVAAEGFYARVLQHEIDHLDGILTLDRAESPDDVRESHG